MGSTISSLLGQDRPTGPNTGAIEANAAGASGTAADARGRAGEQYNWAVEAGNHAIDVGNQVSDRNLGMARENAQNATDAWNSYRNTFMPVQDKMVSDAMNYDSPEQLERVRQAAAGNANAAWDTARASHNLDLEHMGVNPNSARFADPNATSLARAGSVAGSMNQATENRQNTAIGLRRDVSGFGMNVAQLGSQQAGLAYTGNMAATGAVNAATGIASAARTAPAAWSNSAIAGYSGAGNLGIGLANANTSGFNATTGRYEGASNELNLPRSNIGGGIMGMLGLSDENAKEEKLDIDEDRVLEGLKKIPVKAWKYKDGIADSGRHVGPMAQDVYREFGERVAPGGVRLDLLSMHGLALAAVKALARKIDRLSAGLSPAVA